MAHIAVANFGDHFFRVFERPVFQQPVGLFQKQKKSGGFAARLFFKTQMFFCWKTFKEQDLYKGTETTKALRNTKILIKVISGS